MNESFDVIMPYIRQRMGWQARKAETIFNQFRTTGFSYEAILSHPDYLTYASTQFLMDILPKIIDEIFIRNDTDSPIIYSILTALDPELKIYDLDDPEDPEYIAYKNRARNLIELANNIFVAKVCAFLIKLRSDPPVSVEELDRVIRLWHAKAGVIWLSPN